MYYIYTFTKGCRAHFKKPTYCNMDFGFSLKIWLSMYNLVSLFDRKILLLKS